MGRESDHGGVGRERTGPDAQHHAATGQVIEQREAIRDPQRIVIGQRDHTRAELQVAGLGGDMGDEQHRIANDLDAARVMFTEPGFVIADVIQQLDDFDIALQCIGRVVISWQMMGRQKGTETHAGHGLYSSGVWVACAASVLQYTPAAFSLARAAASWPRPSSTSSVCWPSLANSNLS